MNEVTNRLQSLRLSGMAKQWATLLEMRKLESMTLYDGMQMLLQSEMDERKLRKDSRLIKNANFRYPASLENLYLDPKRGILESMVHTLATGQYIEKGESVIITGSSGAGKSFLGSAFGYQACYQGYKVAYYNITKLLDSIKAARLDGTAKTVLEKLAKIDLLIIDDFGLKMLKGAQQTDLMEVIEDRHGLKSTIIIGQLPVSGWHEVLGENLVSDAIMDRIVHTAHRFELKGESLRKK